MKTLEQRVLFLEEEVARLQQLLLEKNNVQDRYWGPFHNNSCGKCGLKLSLGMGYVCNRLDCPTYNVITCKTQIGE